LDVVGQCVGGEDVVDELAPSLVDPQPVFREEVQQLLRKGVAAPPAVQAGR
jgi:hypothetical protein